MIFLGLLLLELTAAVGPNGQPLQLELARPEVGESLPLGELLPAAGQLYVVLHRQESLPRAVFAGADLTPAISLAAGTLGPKARVLPGLEVPRLLLFAPFYQRDGRLVPFARLPIDLAGGLLSSLMEARLVLASEPGLTAYMTTRGAQLMPEVPEEQRTAAYASAVAAMSGHALVVAREMERHRRRVGTTGALCHMLENSTALFRTWDQIFDDGRYYGEYFRPGSEGLWRSTLQPLSREDKRFVRERLLGDRWTGRASEDFAWACPEGPSLAKERDSQ